MRLSCMPISNNRDKTIRISPKLFLYGIKSSGLDTRCRMKIFVVTNKNQGIKKVEPMKNHEEVIVKENGQTYLNIEVIRKMIKRFLIEKEMSREKLAKILEVTLEELDQLLFYRSVTDLIKKVNLQLIKLYCETKFDN